MSAVPLPVWVVGSPTFVQRACGADWPAHGLGAVPLPWSERREVPDAGQGRRALAVGDFELVMLTSVHALGGLPEGSGRGHAAACVGVSTADAARALGFDVVTDERTPGVVGGGRALAAAILARDPRPTRVLWLCGRDRRPEAREPLQAAGVRLDEVVTYAMEPRPDFAATIAAAMPPVAIVVGSPRGSDALAAALATRDRPLGDDVPVVVPRGEVTARHARAHFGNRVVVATCRRADDGTDYPASVMQALEGARRPPPPTAEDPTT